MEDMQNSFRPTEPADSAAEPRRSTETSESACGTSRRRSSGRLDDSNVRVRIRNVENCFRPAGTPLPSRLPRGADGKELLSWIPGYTLESEPGWIQSN
jgi:hypothetical protein